MESCSTETSSSSSSSSSPRQLGRVKWFNNKAGYGFITINDGPLKDTDIFVHHIGINVSNEQYKYLVQGEYVEYDLEKTEGGKHEYQAGKVSGLNGGKLMCETRRDFKQMRSSYQELNQSQVSSQDQMDQSTVTASTTTPVQTTTSATTNSKPSSAKKQPRSKQSTESDQPNKPWSLVKKNSDVKKGVTASKV